MIPNVTSVKSKQIEKSISIFPSEKVNEYIAKNDGNNRQNRHNFYRAVLRFIAFHQSPIVKKCRPNQQQGIRNNRRKDFILWFGRVVKKQIVFPQK